MSKVTAEAIFALPMMFFGILSLLLGLMAIVMAPFLIDKADYYFSPLNTEDEVLFKGYPVSFSRMGRYGFILMLRRTKFIKHRWLIGNHERVHAIDSAPSWIRHVMIWIYGGFGICAAIAFVFGCGMMLIDNYWHVFH